MGKRQEALDVMDEAYMRKNIDALALLSQPDLLALKDDPRYQALARKINFPASPVFTHWLAEELLAPLRYYRNFCRPKEPRFVTHESSTLYSRKSLQEKAHTYANGPSHLKH
jgi:hypothetical protein